MLAPVQWLHEYVDFKHKPLELGWALTEIGLALETIHQFEAEPVLELEVTPNRPDWLSIVGIAREIAVMTNNNLKFPTQTPIKGLSMPLIKYTNDSDACQRYTAISIKNVVVKESPNWLKKRLVQVGLRPINNLVDISNYIMFELGNPIHCFDQDKISGRTMQMKRTQGGEQFTTVDELSYTLPKGAVVIEDAEKLIDLCGIKGGYSTAITEETTNIFIHVPVYKPVLIRRTTTALDLHSEAAIIYERGADPAGTVKALQRAVELTLRLAGGAVASSIIDLSTTDLKARPINLKLNLIDQVVGTNFDRQEVIRILSVLELSPQLHNDSIRCQIPTFRADLQLPEDLIEEVARHWGYNRIPKTLPTSKQAVNPVPLLWDDHCERNLKNLIAAAGFTEISTYSLLSQEEVKHFGIKPETLIQITNPVSRQYQYLQPSLLPSLLLAVKLNQSRFENISLFELAHVFTGRNALNPQEEIHLAAVTTGQDYRYLKGLIEELALRLRLSVDFQPTSHRQMPWTIPSRTAQILIDSQEAGLIGEFHPQILANFGLEQQPAFYFSLNYELLKRQIKTISFHPPSNYPPIIEDLTFAFPTKTLIGDVVKTIKATSNLIVVVDLINQYQDAVTFRLTYQDQHKTLSNNLIKNLRDKVISEVRNQHRAEIKKALTGFKTGS